MMNFEALNVNSSQKTDMDKQKLSKEERFRTIVIKGFKILQNEKSYKQNQIINKLRTLNSAVSTASLSNLLAEKAVGLDVLQKVATGIQEIILAELGYTYKI
jgi:formate dehydrogenase maturation protein FdhE